MGDEVEAKEEEAVEEETKEVEEKAHLIGMDGPTVPFGITSFADYDAMVQAEELTGEMKSLTHAFAEMAENIFMNPDVEDKAQALDTLASEFASRVGSVSTKEMEEEETEDKAVWSTAFINNLPDASFLHIESGGTKEQGKTVPRSKRHLPYKNATGNVDLPHLRNAISRLGQSATGSGGWLTESLRTQLQTKARRILASETKGKSLFDKAIDALKSVFEPEEEEKKDQQSFTIWKEKDGSYRWLATFSNNYRDNDDPPEILAGEAHQDFVKAVDEGEWPYPELWHWHTPGTRWGVADWLAYEGNFALASGSVDKEHNVQAEAIMQMDNLLVSHGMPNKEIERDEEDPTIITRYRSKEISVLPSEAAANPFTGFSVLDKEASMPIPDEKKDFLRDVGLSDEQISQVEADLEGKKETADEAGVESKEETPETQEAVTVEAVSDTTPVTRGEIEELARTVGEGLQVLTAQVSELAGQVKEIEDKEQVSLSDIFKSAAGHEQARVDGRTVLAKAGPKQTEPETGKNEVLASGNLLANDIIGGIVTGSAWKDFPGVQQ